MTHSSTPLTVNGRTYGRPSSPTLAICGDGWSPEYIDDAIERRLMPRLCEALACGGTYELGLAQLPTFTNPNNVSIVTGVSAARHGITGNHFLDDTGREVQMDDAVFLRAETIHEVSNRSGAPAVCVTAKEKLRRLLGAGDSPSYSAERAATQTLPDGTPATKLLGRPLPGIYDWRLSGYTLALALALAKVHDARLVYASLTDAVQHRAAPRSPLSDAFFAEVDRAIGAALDCGFHVGITADHGMSAKTSPTGEPNIVLLHELLISAGVGTGHVVLPITDPYVAHHGGLGSCAYVWVRDPAERAAATMALAAVEGVERVLSRDEAAVEFELPPDRIGDLVVLADAHTVLGRDSAAHDLSQLKGPLRSHGGLHEQVIPLILCQPSPLPRHCRQRRNRDLYALLLGETSTS